MSIKNRLNLIGTIYSTREITPTMMSVCVSVACRRKKPDGTYGIKSEFFDVIFNGGQAETIKKYYKKMDMIAIEAEQFTSRGKKDGKTYKSWICDKFEHIYPEGMRNRVASEIADNPESVDETEEIPF